MRPKKGAKTYRLPYEQRLKIWHRRQAKRRALFEAIGNRCMDCGWVADTPDKLSALHFHHHDPATKKFQISNGLDRSLEALFAEAKKCDIICANCHMTYHAAEHRANLFSEGHPGEEMPEPNLPVPAIEHTGVVPDGL